MKPVTILRDIDPKKFEALTRRFAELAGHSVMVGIPEAENGRTDEGEIGSAGILAVHEFGAPEMGIPERSVVRRSIRENVGKYRKLNLQNLRKVVRGEMSVAQALGILGAVAAGDVQLTIRNADLAPLKPETIRRKGSSKPLIDTGQVIQSITFEVRDA
ncbi:hypothetical protein SAMN02800692_1995 [Luteibacter sp. UNC138MFCol5.1]|uniref:hypothetical protein n=1 Tax=Luteibacter sp. UNC138MFCol5.1 TaxID=1502774 RepID=UPI0008AD4316|nr:hypothetical protein [Luteibacter sp. UNC138MFCol5.1]SEO76391.1 hypothetical protein SAMN02800692_1995 [Luteibacter sp. UNC138MFCol5.1]